MELFSLLGGIVTDVLLPILLMVGVGALVRWRFRLDVGTLSKLNLWVFSPAFIFDKVANSTLPWSAMGGVVFITVLQVIALGFIIYVIGRAAGVSSATLSAMALGTMFYNSGNFGIPLAELAFPKHLTDGVPGLKDGAATQAFVAMTQNFLVFTVGTFLASRGRDGAGAWTSFRAIFSLPAVPVLCLALLARSYLQADPGVHHLPIPISKTISYLSLGLVPVSLVTLGTQLASTWRRPRWGPVAAVCCVRLLVAPALMALMLWGFSRLGWLDLWPWPAELLIVTCAVPSAVNTLLLTIETGGDSELAADCVFWTTILSPLNLALVLAVVKITFGTTA